jgi:hypothetical protein
MEPVTWNIHVLNNLGGVHCGRLTLSFPKHQTERPFFPKADVQFGGKSVKLGSAFGYERPLNPSLSSIRLKDARHAVRIDQ